MKKLSLSNLNDLFSAIAEKENLYIPTDNSVGQAAFSLWSDGAVLSEKCNTVRSAKDLFFPQVENLVNFKVTGKQIEVIENRDPAEPFVVFGVRACDLRSFDILDRVFLSEPVDSYYRTRRENALLIGLACSHPSQTCFCTAFGIDAAEPAGDITCWMSDDTLYWRANTEKGATFTDSLAILDDCQDDPVHKLQEDLRDRLGRLPLHDLDLTGFDSDNMIKLFNSEKWDELSQSCLGCGTCTFICPTCQCYDIQEFNTGKEVKRFRCWDSCMYSNFTKMSAGQPRPTQKERFRQRFMHKLVYYPSNNEGIYSCVGCGRCLQKCPVNANIVKVIKTLREELS
ncbi:MAG: 4Fe-4S dicluster domain-containing protein [Lachnospiraceae bacterium]|nr:4Fe-4S dicluster domain-containing protein [Lachnospiraceae bacterium]